MRLMRLCAMRKVLIISLISIILMLAECSNLNNSKSRYNLDDFKRDMTEKGYDFEVQDVTLHLLKTTAKRMTIADVIIDIYTFRSNKKMESQAKNIVSDGWGYKDDSKMINMQWVSTPHFFKKGKLIVQYIGVEEKVISDLEDILGEQFN